MQATDESKAPYDVMRSGIFDLCNSIEGAVNLPSAAIMEFGRPNAIVTLVGMSDGTASVYFSSGGGILGTGSYDDVRQLARQFVTCGVDLLGNKPLVTSYPAPATKHVRFYLVTPSGVNTAEAMENELGNNQHCYSELFHAGHELLGAIRRAEAN